MSNVYKIYIDTANKKPFYVFCDMDSDDGQGGWTVSILFIFLFIAMNFINNIKIITGNTKSL